MSKTYSITVFDVTDEQELKEIFYSEMKIVSNNPVYTNYTLKDKNNHVMNIIKNKILNLSRQMYIPDITERIQSKKDDDIKREYDTLLKSRNDENQTEKQPIPKELATSIQDNAMTDQEINDRIKQYENSRLFSDIETKKVSNNDDPKEIYNIEPSTKLDINNKINDTIKEYVIPLPKFITRNNYISINSNDRDWSIHKYRYQYVVEFSSQKSNSILNSPKNIENIKVNYVTIPSEICERRTYRYVPKLQYQHDFDFQYPYIILRIDELPSNYDGTNNVVRNCFCKLLFDKTYKTPNGRGYTVLKTMQDESISFKPNRMPVIQQLTFSFLKPNGALFNDSVDDYELFKIEYEAFNPHYLKIFINKYFDKNEFYIGDHITIKNFTMNNENSNIKSPKLVEFINKKEGHDILELGQPNNDGFYNSFYILAPGYIDQYKGELCEDIEIIEALNSYNSDINWNSVKTTCGDIINTSLQNTISMKFTVCIPDSTTAIPKHI
jgi:hypothetical protein